MEERQIRPVQFFTNYDDYYAAIEKARGDLLPLPLAWQLVKDTVPTFEAFCEFVNGHSIENWIFDADGGFSMRFRLSHFKQAAFKAGLVDEASFHVR